jgi:DDE superfamily endonuclease
MWCIPPKASAEFVHCMEDVLEVYHRLYDPRRPVVCMDETFKQLIGEVREPLPLASGRVERYDSVYVRHGVASLFLAFEPLAGWREVQVTDTRKRCDWAHFIRDMIEGRYREVEKVVLVMDQLNTHSPASLYEAFTREASAAAGRAAGGAPHAEARQLAEHGRDRAEPRSLVTSPSAWGNGPQWYGMSAGGRIAGTRRV